MADPDPNFKKNFETAVGSQIYARWKAQDPKNCARIVMIYLEMTLSPVTAAVRKTVGVHMIRLW